MIRQHRKMLDRLVSVIGLFCDATLAVALVALAAATVLALTGCGGGEEPDAYFGPIQCDSGVCK